MGQLFCYIISKAFKLSFNEFPFSYLISSLNKQFHLNIIVTINTLKPDDIVLFTIIIRKRINKVRYNIANLVSAQTVFIMREINLRYSKLTRIYSVNKEIILDEILTRSTVDITYTNETEDVIKRPVICSRQYHFAITIASSMKLYKLISIQ